MGQGGTFRVQLEDGLVDGGKLLGHHLQAVGLGVVGLDVELALLDLAALLGDVEREVQAEFVLQQPQAVRAELAGAMANFAPLPALPVEPPLV